VAEIGYENVTITYDGASEPAVRDLQLDVEDGEFLVLVGPSGSGKSTALRSLAGLEQVTKGRVRIGGRDVTHVPSKDRDVAMVFQNYALYPSKTVEANMGFALKVRGVDKAERERKVREAAELLDLTEYLDRRPRHLSGGQRQRVAMGRAIVREPQVFLMDEPLSNLDAKLRVQTRIQIAALQRRIGVTTVYVTHDQVEAMTMGDRVAVLKDGVLQQVATPRELYDAPVNVFVAGFIGSPAMNLVTLPVAEGGVRWGETHIPVQRDLLAAVGRAGLDRVTVGIRPEQLRPLPEGEGMPAEADAVEALGADAFVYARLLGNRGGDDHGDLNVVVRADGRDHPAAGSRLGVEVLSQDLAVFDPESGERIAA
jgi:multiple sugar transport system ATP-binding protein